MNEKILLWQGLLIGGISAVTVVAIAIIQAAIRIRAEIAKFREIRKTNGTDIALHQTRLSKAYVEKKKL